MKSRLCKQPALVHGWCEEHAVSAQFLDLGAQLDYPALDLSVYCSIGAGIAEWEGFADTVSEKPLLKYRNSIRSKLT